MFGCVGVCISLSLTAAFMHMVCLCCGEFLCFDYYSGAILMFVVCVGVLVCVTC